LGLELGDLWGWMLYPQIDDQIMNCDPLIDDLSTLTKSDLVWRGLNLANWTFMDYVIGENKGVCNLISGINIFSCFFFFFLLRSCGIG
jgi:hypothetical protein